MITMPAEVVVEQRDVDVGRSDARPSRRARFAIGRWPDDAKYSSGMPIQVIAWPQRPAPPLADAHHVHRRVPQVLARSAEVVTTATAPSHSMQKS